MPGDAPELPGRPILEDAQRLLEEALAILDRCDALLPAALTANALESLNEFIQKTQHKLH